MNYNFGGLSDGEISFMLLTAAAAYARGTPVMLDAEYDTLVASVRNAPGQCPLSMERLSKVGVPVILGSKVTRQIPMLSLRDVKTEGGVKEWFDEMVKAGVTSFAVETKKDGISFELIYDQNGELIQASTRGDGTVGEEVTAHARAIESIPKKIASHGQQLCFRGELTMSRRLMDELNAKRQQNGERPYVNPRNAVAGIIGRKTDFEDAARDLLFTPFDCFVPAGFVGRPAAATLSELHTLMDCLNFCSEEPYMATTFSEVMSHIADIDAKRNEFPYDIDGAVVKVADTSKWAALGNTTTHPRHQLAFKYPPQELRGKARALRLDIGRTGVITPVLLLQEALPLAGTMVAAANLHNWNYVESFAAGPGSMVVVRKAGEIIPEVVSVCPDPKIVPFAAPTHCPSCGSPTRRDAQFLYCSAPDTCLEVRVAAITYLVSRSVLDLKNVGEQQIRKRLSEGSLSGLYDLWGEFPTKTPMKLERVIQALLIPQVGTGGAKRLAKAYGSLDEFAAATYTELLFIDDIGPDTATSIIAFLNSEEGQGRIRQVREVFEITDEKEPGSLWREVVSDSPRVAHLAKFAEPIPDAGPYTGKVIAVTGSFPGQTRSTVTSLIESLGGKPTGSVTSKTDYLLAGDNPTQRKVAQAAALQLPVISLDDLRSVTE